MMGWLKERSHTSELHLKNECVSLQNKKRSARGEIHCLTDSTV